MSGYVVEDIPQQPDLLGLHQRYPERYPFLLQSTARAGDLGDCDILFAAPGEIISSDETNGRFLDALDQRFAEAQQDFPSDVPFCGGWFVYLGYELAAEIEPSLSLFPDPVLPAAFAVRCRAAVIRNHSDGRCMLVCESGVDDSVRRQILDDCVSCRFEYREADIQGIDEQDPTRFLDAVLAAKQHIAKGDIYQANLSRTWDVRLGPGAETTALYAALSQSNPGPFSGLAEFRGNSIISSSPERLIEVRGRNVSTRPIAGTRPRSDSLDQDRALSDELIAHPKERAEHVMLIDLERNDLGRVCVPGSVHVDEFMVIESYAHVHHIVSNVRGVLADDVSPGQAMAAVFPGGTITGCPKVRCMQIIAELEQRPRGAYTGAMGYLGLNGDMDLNILIRTMVRHGDHLLLSAGSGIVADSNPESELAETRAKAKGLLRALGQ